MIGRLQGVLLEKQPPEILLDVHGVGYELLLPMTSFYDLPEIGKETTLFTHLVVREDAHLLFGFAQKTIVLYFVNSSKLMVLAPNWHWRFYQLCQ
ncbi:Holliday junction DNA helicase RuvA [Haemophilus pittmaniae HK 85]|uniref:Holliday junction DNA helicase RuvA n=1 Tax=Haemophilus pittmaniae HK 85 TaxID=1035188 RepID=F9QA22_9PAST|nr:Holliday junction DNA helicase RuvA [Haemophilus pittmaniae HK 85]